MKAHVSPHDIVYVDGSIYEYSCSPEVCTPEYNVTSQS